MLIELPGKVEQNKKWVSITQIAVRLWIIVCVTLFAGVQPVFAAAPDAASMFANFTTASKSFILLIQSLSVLMGIIIGIISALKLKEHMDSNGRTPIKAPVVMMFVAAALVGLPGLIDMTTLSIFGVSPKAHGAHLFVDESSIASDTMPFVQQAVIGVLWFLKLVGYIAMVRGLIILKGLGEGKQDSRGLGGALTHILGGAFAINIILTATWAANTLAPDSNVGKFLGM